MSPTSPNTPSPNKVVSNGPAANRPDYRIDSKGSVLLPDSAGSSKASSLGDYSESDKENKPNFSLPLKRRLFGPQVRSIPEQHTPTPAPSSPRHTRSGRPIETTTPERLIMNLSSSPVSVRSTSSNASNRGGNNSEYSTTTLPLSSKSSRKRVHSQVSSSAGRAASLSRSSSPSSYTLQRSILNQPHVPASPLAKNQSPKLPPLRPSFGSEARGGKRNRNRLSVFNPWPGNGGYFPAELNQNPVQPSHQIPNYVQPPSTFPQPLLNLDNCLLQLHFAKTSHIATVCLAEFIERGTAGTPSNRANLVTRFSYLRFLEWRNDKARQIAAEDESGCTASVAFGGARGLGTNDRGEMWVRDRATWHIWLLVIQMSGRVVGVEEGVGILGLVEGETEEEYGDDHKEGGLEGHHEGPDSLEFNASVDERLVKIYGHPWKEWAGEVGQGVKNLEGRVVGETGAHDVPETNFQRNL